MVILDGDKSGIALLTFFQVVARILADMNIFDPGLSLTTVNVKVKVNFD